MVQLPFTAFEALLIRSDCYLQSSADSDNGKSGFSTDMYQFFSCIETVDWRVSNCIFIIGKNAKLW